MSRIFLNFCKNNTIFQNLIGSFWCKLRKEGKKMKNEEFIYFGDGD